MANETAADTGARGMGYGRFGRPGRTARSDGPCSGGFLGGVGRRGVASGEPCAQVDRVRVPQAPQDRQRLAPGRVRGGRLAGGLLRVGEISERRGFVRAVTQLGEQAVCVPVAGGGIGEAAESMLREADRRPGMRLAVTGAELLGQLQGLPAEDEGPLILAEQHVVGADVAEGKRLPVPVGDSPGQAEGLLRVAESLVVTLLILRQAAEV